MKLSVKLLPFQLSKPFVSHKGVTAAEGRHVLLQIDYQQHQGYGVAVPAKEYGTTVETLKKEADIAAVILEKFSNPFEVVNILIQCHSLSSATLSAVDMALHDLIGKVVNLPLNRYFGLDSLLQPACSTSLGLMSDAETVEKVMQFQQKPILKLKMSQPDEHRVKLIRQHYQGKLWIDGNGAWSVEQALQVVRNFIHYDIELIEQPLAKGTYKELKKIKEATNILIIADEDCVSLTDVMRLHGYVDGVNIKLLKSGGLSNAKKMIETAKALDMKVMLGCKVESALGVTAMSHLAGLADFLDLDGHLDNIKDPFSGLKVTDGVIHIPDLPGIGCQIIGETKYV